MRNILSPLIQTLRRGSSAILAAIIKQQGSAPRGSGAKMLVTPDGVLYGSIGGGEVEAQCHNAALRMLCDKTATALLSFNLNNEKAADSGLICGGTVDVLLFTVSPTSLPCWLALERVPCNRQRTALLFNIPEQGEAVQLSLYSEGEIIGAAIPDAIMAETERHLSKTRLPGSIQQKSGHYYLEPQTDPKNLWLVGAGHVSQATAQLAAKVDFAVHVLDDRAEFASVERFPDAAEVRVLDNFSNCFGQLGPNDCIVIVTRGHLHDREVLRQALLKTPGYIGMIGSRKKRETTYRTLRETGITEEQLAKVHCPIGISIGADTPQEIALSIVAELVSFRAGLIQ